jgi:heptosyltransferase-2
VRKGSTESSITSKSRREQFLVYAPNWLGDAVMATPFLFALRSRRPQGVVTIFCRAYVAELFRRCTAVDSIVEHERRSVWARASAISSSAPRAGYDVCFVLPPSFSSVFVSIFSRARRRIGYGGQGRGSMLTDALPPSGYRATHLSMAYLRLLEVVTGGHEEEAPPPVVVAPESWRATAERVSNGGRYFVLAPGSAYGSSKVWPHERFASLAARLASRTGWLPVIVGRADEKAGGETIARASGVNVVNCAGTLSLGELISVLRGSSATIGNDSGPVHISAALGKPTVAIFGPSSAAWTAPRGRAVRIVAGKADCAPCFERDCPKKDAVCLSRVGVEEVYRETVSLLEEVPDERG